MVPSAAGSALQDRFTAWGARPPTWARRVRRGVGLAAPILLVGYGMLYEQNSGLTPTTDAPVVRLGLYALAGASLYINRRTPYLTVLFALLCWWGTGSALFAIAASFLVSWRQPRWWWAYIVVMVAAHPIGLVPEPQVFAAGHALLPSEVVPVYASVVPALAGFTFAMAGRAATQRNARFEADIAAAHAEAQSKIAVDRLRISQEMHDILGHRLSLMVLHATAADSLVSDPKAHELLSRIADDGAKTVKDLQYILDLLRRPALVPENRLPSVRESIALAEQEGLRVDDAIDHRVLDRLGSDTRTLVEATAREALHNATKYAPGSAVVMRCFADGSCLTFVVENGSGSIEHSSIAPGGFGLTDLARRVEEAGGALSAGPTETHGFRVEIRLPM